MPADEKDATAAVVRHLERAAAARGVPLWEAARESLGAKVELPSPLPVTFVSRRLKETLQCHIVSALRLLQRKSRGQAV